MTPVSFLPYANKTGINTCTHWPDLSNVYGNDHKAAFTLYDQFTGNMLTLYTSQSLNTPVPDYLSQVAGDSRINKVPGLMAMWDLFKKIHNSFVFNFTVSNPEWTPY